MKPDFDWRSEDELLIDGDIDNPIGRSGLKLSKWWLIGLTFLSLILVGWILLRQLQQYVVETASVTEDEIEQSLDFLLEAQESGDLELFSSFISGRDRGWAEHQLLLMEAGLLIDREQFGLTLLTKTEPEETNLTISPDLDEAVLEQTFSYKVKGASSDLDTVDLRQLFIFRMGRDRWLLSPPDKSFWGTDLREAGRFVTVIYPERDGEVSRRLAADLEGTVAAACSISRELCNDKLNVTIELSSDPEVIYQRERPDQDLLNSELIILPTVSLFGRPTDEAGYRAILRLFSEILVRRLLDQQARYACCNKPGFYAALSNEQLYHLGIIGPGESSEFQASLTVGQIFELWQRDADGEPLSEIELREIEAFIDELVEGLRAEEISELQQKLIRTDDFWGWINQVQPSLLSSS